VSVSSREPFFDEKPITSFLAGRADFPGAASPYDRLFRGLGVSDFSERSSAPRVFAPLLSIRDFFRPSACFASRWWTALFQLKIFEPPSFPLGGLLGVDSASFPPKPLFENPRSLQFSTTLPSFSSRAVRVDSRFFLRPATFFFVTGRSTEVADVSRPFTNFLFPRTISSPREIERSTFPPPERDSFSSESAASRESALFRHRPASHPHKEKWPVLIRARAISVSAYRVGGKS